MKEVTAMRGLTSVEAAARRARDGPNRLPAPPPHPAWRQLVAQLAHFFALMLWVAAGLAVVARMPQLGIAIAVVVVVNGLFAFAQERRADNAAARLRDLLPRRASVLRDGVVCEIDADDLVVGDVVVLTPGDRVSADLVALEAHGLAVDVSSLTGESVPDHPDVGDGVAAGCFVVEGEGLAEVVATGAATRLAGIALLTHGGLRPPGPLAQEIDRVVRIVAVLAIGVGAFFFAVALLVGEPASDGFLFAIGVTVALVPEGLLPTVTLALAMGAQRMAGRHALVRRLEAVETLGSTTFLCTDKTGTLTRNEMAVVEVWLPEGKATIRGVGYEPAAEVHVDETTRPAFERLTRAARACSDGRAVLDGDRWVAHGDPMEAAIDALARRCGLGEPAPRPNGLRFAFDPRRRRMSVVTDDELVVKGAPDTVLSRCTHVAGAPLAVQALASRGCRVLAVAARPATCVGIDDDADAAEHDLTLLGLLALEDPPRAEAARSIGALRAAGVKVAMVTGDLPATARAIAAQVGLLLPDSPRLEGHDLPPDEQVLGLLLDHDGTVVSRVNPEDKLRIAAALQARGHVVAMTGDGVNDGPALHQADIGIAMGRSGTDVAREAADLVLLDDDIATIVAAVEQGRVTFTNIRRFLTYHLTDNVAELTPFVVWALSGGRFPLALGVLQILALDIGTDLLPALALGAEPGSPRALARPPHTGHLLDRRVLRRVFGALGPAEAVVEMAAFLAVFLAAGWRPGQSFPEGDTLLAASGAAFTAVVLGQLANAFACRSATVWAGALPLASNRLLLGAVAAEVVALAVFLTIPSLAHLLGHTLPGLVGLLVAAVAIPAVIAADAAEKATRHRAVRPPPRRSAPAPRA